MIDSLKLVLWFDRFFSAFSVNFSQYLIYSGKNIANLMISSVVPSATTIISEQQYNGNINTSTHSSMETVEPSVGGKYNNNNNGQSQLMMMMNGTLPPMMKKGMGLRFIVA